MITKAQLRKVLEFENSEMRLSEMDPEEFELDYYSPLELSVMEDHYNNLIDHGSIIPKFFERSEKTQSEIIQDKLDEIGDALDDLGEKQLNELFAYLSKIKIAKSAKIKISA